MLSKNSRRLLKWMASQDVWVALPEIEEKCKDYDDRSLKFLVEGEYLERAHDPIGKQWVRYRISEKGKVCLADIRSERMSGLRDWISFAIPVITFIAGLSLSDSVKSVLRWFMELFD